MDPNYEPKPAPTPEELRDALIRDLTSHPDAFRKKTKADAAKEFWDSVNPKPEISFPEIHGKTGVHFGLRWSF